MSEAKSGDTVRVHYTGRLADGTEFDSSAGREPLEFTLGAGNIIPGLDRGIQGMTIGQKATVEVACEDAYGKHHPEGVQQVPRSVLPEDANPQVGGMLQAQTGDGQRVNLIVTEVTEDMLTVDGNHPLAGKDLVFDVELMEIL